MDPVKHVPLKGMRKTIARRMRESWVEKPQVTLYTRVMVDALREFHKARRPAWEEEAGAPVTFTVVLAYVVGQALHRDPTLNGWIQEEGVDLYSQVNLGVAVALPRGLIVPVIHGVEELAIPDLARRLADLTTRAREGTLEAQDVTGGTFTLTNLGMFGIRTFSPIINPPQLGILGVGAVEQVPVWEEGAWASRAALELSLTFDHAALDGAQAAAWLQGLVRLLEDPSQLMAP